MNLTDEKILELAIGGGIYDCICDPYDKNGDGDQQSSIMHDLVRFARAILKEAGVEELERDAERYRWLRDGGVTHSATLFVSDDEGYDLCDSVLDDAIDEAM